MRPTSKNLPPLIVVLSCLLILIMQVNSILAMQIDQKVSIELPWLPSIVKPGAIPFPLSRQFLSEVLPELKNPRFMSFNNIGDDYWKEEFLRGGFSFVLADDFKRDGIADVVFVGKYDNYENPELNTFLAFVSVNGTTVTRDLLITLPFPNKSVWLCVLPNYKPGVNAIRLLREGESEDQ